jgi:hypothetical protein
MQVGDLQALLTPKACSPITIEGKLCFAASLLQDAPAG